MRKQKVNSNNELGEKLILQWVGDISLNGWFCNPQHHKTLVRDMAKIANDAGQCDLRIGNLESPLWGDGGENILKEPRICTTEEAARCILPLSLDVVLLANNHVYDCLEKGFENTISFLKKNKIQYLGAGISLAEAERPLILGKKGLHIALLNYVSADTHPNIPAGAGVFLNMFDEERVFSDVAELKKEVDIILLNLHWGAVELVRFPTTKQRGFARRVVEAGATVVACHHAHCLQGHEDWMGSHIFYGLGNFLFGARAGQIWPELSHRTALANVVVSKGRVEKAWLRHLYQKDSKLQWDNRAFRKRMQCRLNRYVKFSEKLHRLVYKCELLYQIMIVSYFRFVRKSGGFIPSLFRIRKRHIRVILGLLIKHVWK